MKQMSHGTCPRASTMRSRCECSGQAVQSFHFCTKPDQVGSSTLLDTGMLDVLRAAVVQYNCFGFQWLRVSRLLSEHLAPAPQLALVLHERHDDFPVLCHHVQVVVE